MTPIQRVLVAPLNYSHRQAGQIQAFKNVFGAENVAEFDYMGRSRNGESPRDITATLVEVAMKFQPDWIWLQVQGSDVIQAHGITLVRKYLPHCLVTHWMGDARTSVPRDLAEMCRVTHATLISSVGQLDMYRAVGATRAHYVQIGLDEDEDVHGIPPWEPPFAVPDVVFCGGFYGKAFDEGSRERVAAITALRDAGIAIGVVGTGWPRGVAIGQCHVKQQHHVYTRAKVVLSVNHFNSIERYYSDRQLIAMASGRPVVCRYVPGLEEEFMDGRDCAMWRTTDELVVRTRRLLDNPELAAQVGAAGREIVLRDHTWTARIQQLRPDAEAWHGALA